MKAKTSKVIKSMRLSRPEGVHRVAVGGASPMRAYTNDYCKGVKRYSQEAEMEDQKALGPLY
jgi:hypothetical protein